MDINRFDGENQFLSNFYSSHMMVLGIKYANSEAAYQASKTLIIEERYKFSHLLPGDAKKLGRKVTLRDDWDEILKVEMMELVLRSKFIRPSLQQKLMDTGDALLIEGNHWGDTFWGVCGGAGQNMLGKLLMEIRKDLQHWRDW